MKHYLIALLFLVAPYSVFASTSAYLLFNGHVLELRDSNNCVIKQWESGAGAPFSNTKDQSKKNIGPLPEGGYTVQIDQTVFFNRQAQPKTKLKWLIKFRLNLFQRTTCMAEMHL
jgi:hypothetical protein